MRDQIKEVLEENIRGEKPHFIVGVSGGPDSLSLLHCLQQIGIPVIAAHLDHGLREDSIQDTEQVAAWANDWGIPFVSERVDVVSYSKENSQSVEEAARILRYRFLFRVAEENDAQAVIVAHTADDQVETILMHLLRGAGMAGLSGMKVRSTNAQFHSSIPLLRPMLNVWRREVLAYCAENDLRPLEDPTNMESTFFRNRLRHELLPELEKINPQIRGLLLRTADTLSGDNEYLNTEVEKHWGKIIKTAEEGFVEIYPSIYSDLHLSLQRGLARKAIAQLRPNLRDITYDVIERMRRFITNPERPARVDLIGGLMLLSEGQSVWLASWDSDLPVTDWPQINNARTLPIPGTLELPNGWQFVAQEIMKPTSAIEYSNDPFSAIVDGSRLNGELLLRPRQRGDWFAPLGMDGHSMKLADLYINHKLPARARDGWPLVCAGKEIIWVPGIRLGNSVRITSETQDWIILRLENRRK